MSGRVFDAYIKSCTQKNAAIIPSFKTLIDLKESTRKLPEEVVLKGSSKELQYARIDDSYVDILMVPFSVDSFLKRLDLSYNDIGDIGAVTIAQFLLNDIYLESLFLNYNVIGPVGCVALAKSIQLNRALVFLDLSGNPIGDEGGMEIASALQIGANLKTLKLSRCGLRSKSLIAVASVTGRSTSLLELDISNNNNNTNISTQSNANNVMMHFANAISVNTDLKSLNMSQMGITDWSVVDLLAEAIQINECLTHLDLSSNHISIDGCKAICKALRMQNTLSSLKLSCCAIQDEGAEAISELIKASTTIKHLYIDYNRITGAGLLHLAHALTLNATLETLFLWGNKWSEEACKSFCTLLGGPTSIIQLDEGKKKTAWAETKPATKIKTDVTFYAVEGIVSVASLQS